MNQLDPTTGAPIEDGDLYSQIVGDMAHGQRAEIDTGLESNPDDAAESMHLSDLTGDPAPAIMADLDQYKENLRRNSAMQLVLNNPELVTYLQSHPMASAVSNDDWANLDQFSHNAGLTASLMKDMTSTLSSPVRDVEAALSAFGPKFAEGFGPEPIGSQSGQLASEAYDPETQRLGWAASTSLLEPGELLLRTMSGLASGASAAVGAAAESHLQGIKDRTGVDLNPAGAGQAASQMVDWALQRGDMPLHGEGPHTPAEQGVGIDAGAVHDEFIKQQTTLNEAIAAGKPWIDSGMEPPVGIHSLIDEAKAKMNSTMLDSMEMDLQNAQASLTKERSPELFQQFVAQHFGESTFDISSDAVLGLYGDKAPTIDDGMLGWIPNLDTQLMAARDTGTGITVKVSDWLAKVDPALATQLHDDIRMWPGGVTVNEAKELPEPHAVIGGDSTAPPATLLDGPLPQVRSAAGLEPKFSMGDRKLSLLKGTTEESSFTEAFGGKLETYNIHDENGQPVGQIELAPGADKTLYVNMINGSAGLWSNSFGPALMRDLKRQIKALYPDYEYLTGNRVSGAREGGDQFGTLAKVKLATGDDIDPTDHQKMQDIFQNGWQQFNSRIEVNEQGKDFFTPNQLAQGQIAHDELSRITGSQDIRGVAGIRKSGTDQTIRGVYQPYIGRPPTVLYDLLGNDVVGVGRHEAIHYLRNNGFFKPKEWSSLESAAQSEGWMDRYGIADRYGNLPHEDQLEEAVAEGFREWAKQAPEIRPKTGVGAIFQKMWEFLDRIRTKMGSALGHTPTWEEVFQRTHSGEVASRGPGEPLMEGAFDLRQKFAIEGDDNLRAQSVGLDLPTFRRLQDQIRKSHEEDITAAIKHNEKLEAQRQTKEWKSNRVDMAREAAADIRQRPDIAADQFIGSGELFGKKLAGRYTLRADDFTLEQRAAMPAHYTSASGLPADQVAGMFGYGSKDELASALTRVNVMRTGVDGGRVAGHDFMRQLVQTETDRRMEQRYGRLQNNIVDAATDRALSETNINIMHEELMAVAQRAGVTAFSKDVMQTAAKGLVDEFSLAKVNSYRLMQEMGKHSRDAEKALLSGDPASAAVAMQKQTLTAMVAKEAKAIEKEMSQFDKTAKRMSKREVPSMDPEYTNWVHSILMQVGKKVRRTGEDLQREISAAGSGDTLQEFVDGKAQWLREVPVWDQLYDAKWSKGYKDLLVPEFRAVSDSVKTLIHNGRDERKIFKAGAEADFGEIKSQMIDALGQFKERDVEADMNASIAKRLPRSFLANSLQLENVLNRWDSFDKYGVWNQYVMRDLIDGVNQSDAWKKEFSGKLAKLKDIDDMHANVENPGLWRAPENYGGRTLTMTRENLHAVMLNVGSKSNLAKLAKGWQVDPAAAMKWVQDKATKADWDRVQGLWDIFDEMKERSDTMYRSLASVPAEDIQATPIETAHGSYRGGYYPIIYHPAFEGSSRKMMGSTGLVQEGFESAATPAGYTKSRTAYTAPLAMTLDQMPNRFSQMIHDTALRPAVVNASKVFKDPDIRAAVATHYGVEYRDMLTPWLRGIANASNSVQKDAAWLNGVSEFMRQNLITALVGLNPGTVMKHGPTAFVLSLNEVGPKNFFNAVHGLFSVNEETGDKNWDFAVKNSLELQRRDRNWQETLYGATGELQAGTKFGTWRQKIMQWSSKPVALSDMISATPTWLAQYQASVDDGRPHGDAVYEADRAVRRAHGSTAVTNRPMITNQVSPWLTSVYNFFNDVMNRQMETLWQAGEGLKLAKDANYDAAMKKAGVVSAGMFAYAVWPAIVENWVSPQPSNPQDSTMKRAAKAVAFTAGASWVGIRDLTNAILDARDPDVGLASTEGRQLTELWRDFGKKEPASLAHAQKMIRDAGGFIGALTGVPDQASKELSAGYGLAQGTEHPRGPWGWLVLWRYGTGKGHSATMQDYMAGRSLPNR